MTSIADLVATLTFNTGGFKSEAKSAASATKELEQSAKTAGDAHQQLGTHVAGVAPHMKSAEGAATGLGTAFKGVGDHIKSTTSSVTDIKGHLSTLAPMLAGVGTAFAGAFAMKEAIGAASELGSEVNKMTRELGLSATQASKLHFEAQETGVGFESLEKNMVKFEKGLAGVADSEDLTFSTGKALKANLHALGVETEDASGKTVPLTDTIAHLADKFKEMPNGTEKSALAIQLFGKSGLEMLPFLNKGSEGLAELGKEAEKFGLVLDQKTLDALKRQKAATREFHAALEGIKVQIGVALIPVMTFFAQQASHLAIIFNEYVVPAIKLFFSLIGDGIHFLVDFLKPFAAMAWNAIVNAFTSIGSAIERIAKIVWSPLHAALLALQKAVGMVSDWASGHTHLLKMIAVFALFGPIGLAIYDHFSKIKAVFMELAGAAWDKLQSAWEKIKEAAGGVAGLSWGNVLSFVAAAWDKVQTAWEKISDATIALRTIAWNAIVEFANAAWDKVKEAWGPIKEGAIALASLAWESITAFANAAWGTVAAAWPAIKEGAIGLGSVAWDKVSNAFTGIDWAGAAAGAKNLAASAGDLGNWANAWEKIKDAVGPAIDLLRPLVEGMLASLLSLVTEVGAALAPLGEAFVQMGVSLAPLLPMLASMEPILKPLAEVLGIALVVAIGAAIISIGLMANAIKVILIAAIDLLTAAIRAETIIIDTTIKFWQNAFDAGFKIIQGYIDVFIGLFTGDWDRMFKGIKEIISGAWEGIWGSFNTLFDGIKRLAKAVVGDLISIGADIVAGLAKGMWDKAQEIIPTIVDKIIGLIPGPMRKLIGAGSPSKLMADEVGAPLVEGIAMGMIGALPVLMGAVQIVTGTLVASVTGIVGAAVAAATVYVPGRPIAEDLNYHPSGGYDPGAGMGGAAGSIGGGGYGGGGDIGGLGAQLDPAHQAILANYSQGFGATHVGPNGMLLNAQGSQIMSLGLANTFAMPGGGFTIPKGFTASPGYSPSILAQVYRQSIVPAGSPTLAQTYNPSVVPAGSPTLAQTYNASSVPAGSPKLAQIGPGLAQTTPVPINLTGALGQAVTEIIAAQLGPGSLQWGVDYP